MTGSHRHGWAVFAAMGVLFFAGVTTAYWAESKGNPLLHGVDQNVSAMQPGGNMEGKEVRFGVANSALFATVTTDASCGAVNGVHDSYTPLAGTVALVDIGLGSNRYYNLPVGFATLIGRFLMIVPMLAVAGSLVRKKTVPPSPGTFPVTTPLFTVLVVSVIIIVGALTFFPALSLGPILEHLLMNAGKTF